MTDEIQVPFEILDSGVLGGYSLLGKVLKTRVSETSLSLFRQYVKDRKNALADMSSLLVGVADKQLLITALDRTYDENLHDPMLDNFKGELDGILTAFVGKTPWWIRNMWVNFMGPCDFQPLHHHNGFLSFVWYIDVPEVIYKHNDDVARDDNTSSPYGEIHFVTPSLDDQYATDTMKLRPMTGDLLIFDSRHQHVLYPFKADVERISISGNIDIQR